MGKNEKSISDITVQDVMRYPVWEYINDVRCPDESWVRPVRRVPVDSLEGRVIGIQVRLANGEHRWATLEGICLGDDLLTRHVISLDVFDHGQWFPLTMHGIGYARYGPQQLADFLGLSIDEVFPIHYDYTHLVTCHGCQTTGEIRKEPIERLPHDEVARMITEYQCKQCNSRP